MLRRDLPDGNIRVLLNLAIVAAVAATAALLLAPRVAHAHRWRAAITPLASIIGSGFLVLAPILVISYGSFAPVVMVGLCAAAFLFGAAIRFNIAAIERGGRGRTELVLETLASWALSFAYVISVAYYLNLFGAFAVSLTGSDDRAVHARLVTTAVFLVILAVGWFRGFRLLEQLEYLSVTVKLAIIAGLLAGLVAYFAMRSADGSLVFSPSQRTGWDGLTLAFGLLITVQGFETSRYLGREYDASERIRSMRLAQLVSTGIYVVYIALVAYVFEPASLALDETAVIAMMARVAPILPFLLVAAALSAQFSAAIADTGGSGGLVAELTGNRFSARQGYALLVAIGLVLTWSADVFQIINYASRAFALYYALQALIAASAAGRCGQRSRAALFLVLAGLGWAIAIFGEAVGV
jgi:hypothetical protein